MGVAALGAMPLTAPAAADEGSATAGPAIDVAASDAQPGETEQFWTPERLREALANDMPEPAGHEEGEGEGESAPTTRDSGTLRASAPSVLPENDLVPVAAREAQPLADPVSRSERVQYPGAWPTVVVGRLVAEMPDGSLMGCSASVINTDTENAVWTAGHCVHPGDGSGPQGFYDHIAFVPAARGDDAPWGLWEWEAVYSPQDWTREGDNEVADMAAVILQEHPLYGNMEDTLGALGYSFGTGSDYDNVYSYGYPSDGYDRPDQDFNNGDNMMYCFGNAEDAEDWWPWDDRIELDCDMGRGASGGPMVIGAPDGDVQIVGANSHREGDDDGNFTSIDLYSSEHGDHAVSLVEEVNADA
jgi:hypothetical protein